MERKKIICLIGDNQILIEKHIEKIKLQFGDYNFANDLESLKPMQQWLIEKNNSDLIKINESTSINLLIVRNFLHEIPIEIRIWAEIFIYNKDIPLNIKNNKNQQLWELMFAKYIPKDLLKTL
jgi:hypothetical protein